MKRIMVDMSATLIHYGHTRLLENAAAHGQVIIGLTSDQEIFQRKGHHPEMAFDQRKEILLALRHVTDVVETPWLITDQVLNTHNIDLLVHGDDNSNDVSADRLLIFPRTVGISSWQLRQLSQISIVSRLNHQLVVAPGPAGLCEQSFAKINPGYYYQDPYFRATIDAVLGWLQRMNGLPDIEVFASTVATIRKLAIDRYVTGRVLVVASGSVSRQIVDLALERTDVSLISEAALSTIVEPADWLIAAYVDEEVADKQDVKFLRAQADRLGARLYLDATFSMGLEDSHHLADLLTFDSCHGLFGLTGAAFISSNRLQAVNQNISVDETPPLHALQSLQGLISHHTKIVERVRQSKTKCMNHWAQYLPAKPLDRQPLLCTKFRGKVTVRDDNVTMYRPDNQLAGSIIYHLGEVHDNQVLITERLKMSPA